jgi:hypothetical protein
LLNASLRGRPSDSPPTFHRDDTPEMMAEPPTHQQQSPSSAVLPGADAGLVAVGICEDPP